MLTVLGHANGEVVGGVIVGVMKGLGVEVGGQPSRVTEKMRQIARPALAALGEGAFMLVLPWIKLSFSMT
jgi:hypothetical protein